MEETNDSKTAAENRSNLLFFVLPLVAAVIYYFSNPKPQDFYNYTFLVAGNLLHGATGLSETPPTWLNEFVPFHGHYYSVFPLGAVLSMIPFALLAAVGIIHEMPGAFIAAMIAGGSCYYLLKIADKYEISISKKILLTLAVLFGTWTWTNLAFEGAWQLAIGFAFVGEVGAVHYSVFERRPFIAGAFFALAFGNRTEVLLTAPIFLYLLNRNGPKETEKLDNDESESANTLNRNIVDALWFCLIPFVLGVATLIYNYLRFHSFTDFGYARIPGVLNEPWYNHGIFSLTYIPRQAWEMLWKPWRFVDVFPYLVPNGFSSSILWSSPFLLFLLRSGSRDKVLKYLSWVAIALLTFLLWIHGNSGGWQFGYRYATVLLPWVFVILLETSSKKISPLEWAVYVFSFVMNAYATWLFHWTDYIKP
jgi:hypothetical protein